MDADKVLNDIDVSQTRQQAYYFCEIARPWIVVEKFEEFRRMTFLMFHLAADALRLARAVEGEEARAIVGDYKKMIRTQLWQFARPD